MSQQEHDRAAYLAVAEDAESLARDVQRVLEHPNTRGHSAERGVRYLVKDLRAVSSVLQDAREEFFEGSRPGYSAVLTALLRTAAALEATRRWLRQNGRVREEQGRARGVRPARAKKPKKEVFMPSPYLPIAVRVADVTP